MQSVQPDFNQVRNNLYNAPAGMLLNNIPITFRQIIESFQSRLDEPAEHIRAVKQAVLCTIVITHKIDLHQVSSFFKHSPVAFQIKAYDFIQKDINQLRIIVH